MHSVAWDCVNTVKVTEQHLEKQRPIKGSPRGLRKGKPHFSKVLRGSKEKMAMQGLHIVFLQAD